MGGVRRLWCQGSGVAPHGQRQAGGSEEILLLRPQRVVAAAILVRLFKLGEINLAGVQEQERAC